jgi:hypothetical protein
LSLRFALRDFAFLLECYCTGKQEFCLLKRNASIIQPDFVMIVLRIFAPLERPVFLADEPAF